MVIGRRKRVEISSTNKFDRIRKNTSDKWLHNTNCPLPTKGTFRQTCNECMWIERTVVVVVLTTRCCQLWDHYSFSSARCQLSNWEWE